MSIKKPGGIYIISLFFIVVFIYSTISSIIAIKEIYSLSWDEIKKEDPARAEEIESRFISRGLEVNEVSIKMMAVFGIMIMLISTLLGLGLGIGLWYLKNWVRIATITICFIFSGFLSLGMIMATVLNSPISISAILYILIPIGIGLELIIDPRIKNAFTIKKR
jgi:hypothetical protein